MGLFDLLRGYAPIGPEHFALNPDNWVPPLSDEAPSWPPAIGGHDASGVGFGFWPTAAPIGLPPFSTELYGSVISPYGSTQPKISSEFADLLAPAGGDSAGPDLDDGTARVAQSTLPLRHSPFFAGLDTGAPVPYARPDGDQPVSSADTGDSPPGPASQVGNYAGQIANTIWDAINPFPPAQAHENEVPANISAALRARVAAGKLSEQEAARIESQFSGLDRWTKDAIAARAQIEANALDPAITGSIGRSNYRRTFLDAHPELEGNVVVHHAIEQQALGKYPGLFTAEEIHSLDNLRGIPTDQNSALHLQEIRKEWSDFYKGHPTATREDLQNKVKEIDEKYGARFLPPIGRD